MHANESIRQWSGHRPRLEHATRDSAGECCNDFSKRVNTSPASVSAEPRPDENGWSEPVPTHAECAAQLLRDAALLFRNLGEHDRSLESQMRSNARTYEQLAELVEGDPRGLTGGKSNCALASQMLRDTGVFFGKLAQQNELIQEQMGRTSEIYLIVAERVQEDPFGVMEDGMLLDD